MRLNGRVDTILGSTYWEDGKLLSIHTNAMASITPATDDLPRYCPNCGEKMAEE